MTRSAAPPSPRGTARGTETGAPGALTVDVQVVPRAARVALGPMVDGRLRVAVTAPPVDGLANAAVVEALAEAFGVRRAAVAILRGQTGRRKTVRIQGVTAPDLARIVAGGGRR